MAKIIMLSLLSTMATACGSGGTNIGSVDGISLRITEMLSNTYTTQDANNVGHYAATIILADFSSACASLTAKAPPGNALILDVLDSNVITTGTYPLADSSVVGPKVVFVNSNSGDQANTGSITLTTIGTDGSLKGSFAATFDSGSVSGSFDGTVCTNINDTTLRWLAQGVAQGEF